MRQVTMNPLWPWDNLSKSLWTLYIKNKIKAKDFVAELAHFHVQSA